MAESSPLLERKDEDGAPTIVGHGEWTVQRGRELSEALAGEESVRRFELGDVRRLDTCGAWLLHRACRRAGDDVAVEGLDDSYRELLDQVAGRQDAVAETLHIPQRRSRLARLEAALLAPGRAAATDVESFLGFLGLVVLTFARIFTGRTRVPLTSIVHHMQQVWINALPIVGFLTLVVGASIIFGSSGQFARFGAEIFAINLVALAILREVGVIIAAIVTAGRSGSAFAVEIGTMKTRQEMDAMQAMGIDPIAALVLPRLIAIVIAFPLLAFFGDIMGVLGGAISTVLSIGLTWEMFVNRFAQVTNIDMFVAGMIKTPFLALTIGLIGCWQGMRVEGGVEQLGRRTTTAVVQALFFVLLVDSVFIVILNLVGI